MPYTEFYVQTTGSNLNAGSTTADTASLTYASGSWVAATGVFTVASGNPASDGVAVGDFASVYNDGATVGVFVGRVTARDTTTITVSLTAKSGTAPTNGTNNCTLKIGGAWKGENGAEYFPFDFASSAMTDASGNYPRINRKAGTQYNITATMNHTLSGPIVFEGYGTTIGDSDKTITDGGTIGTSFTLLNITGNNVEIRNMQLQNNGSSAMSSGFTIAGTRDVFRNCTVFDTRRSGFSFFGSAGIFIECAAIRCNQANDSPRGGFNLQTNQATLSRCVASECNGSGFICFLNTNVTFSHCIAASNTLHGFAVTSGSGSSNICITGCDSFNNGGDGIDLLDAPIVVVDIESSNFVRNSGYGINSSGGSARIGAIRNCGFGSNATGTIATGIGATLISDSVSYPSGSTPWNDPDNDDFTIVSATAQGAGRGTFPFAATIGYPDVGSAQSLTSTESSSLALDRLLEERIAALIDTESSGIQCVPNLMAGGEARAILPRVVVKSESQESPDFQKTSDGIYGVCACSVVVSSIAEATNPISSAQMEEMNSAIDTVIDDPLLSHVLSVGRLKVFGVVPGDYEQEMVANKIVRIRNAQIWARLQ